MAAGIFDEIIYTTAGIIITGITAVIYNVYIFFRVCFYSSYSPNV